MNRDVKVCDFRSPHVSGIRIVSWPMSAGFRHKIDVAMTLPKCPACLPKCPACQADCSGGHPDGECPLASVYDVIES